MDEKATRRLQTTTKLRFGVDKVCGKQLTVVLKLSRGGSYGLHQVGMSTRWSVGFISEFYFNELNFLRCALNKINGICLAFNIFNFLSKVA